MGFQMSELSYIYLPETITVHTGPPDSQAVNVTLPFIDYVKNVASSELYPTWPENAIRANVHAIVSIALNRMFTEWYRSRGYDFDITSSTQFDQSFVPNREIFDNISRIVDETFDDYIVRGTRVEPLYAVFCDGRVSQCSGMYQWGTVDLANEGYSPLEILRYYYGQDVNLVLNAPVGEFIASYPGYDLKLGDSGQPVYFLQLQLNNISTNYPAIPKILPVDGVFSPQTEAAVRAFQTVFNLPSTGTVDKGTWYRVRFIHDAVRKLAELTSGGLFISELPVIRNGIRVPRVQLVQYYLNVLSAYYDTIPPVEITGVLDAETSNALVEFQKTMNIRPVGIISDETWAVINNMALGIFTNLTPDAVTLPYINYPGIIYEIGDIGPGVLVVQLYLYYIASRLQNIPPIPYNQLNFEFGQEMDSVVKAFQQEFGLEPDGIVDEETWNKMVDVYLDLKSQELNAPPTA